ncbi:hypothetical protein [Vibrio ostreae]|uniref:Uncharacterized protein n=1 Tax=Vibrio ostreae TaxID=2841925 RepID=A0A975YQ33_9VIBR|nr:hypothetical protein [Vibrio ostreae]QXO19140.1 hypothetical protein KNV97_13160 [Vibrio ostreae]
MKNDHLPILYMLVSSATLMKRQWRLLLCLSWPCLLVSMLTALRVWYFQSDDGLLATLLNIMVFIAVLVWATVRWHRAILMRQSQAQPENVVLSAKPEVRILGYVLVIMLVGLICLLAGMLTQSEVLWLQLGSELMLMVPLAWVISRWGLAIPATAVEDKEYGLYFAWQVSRQYRGALFVLIGLLPALLALLLVSASFDHVAVAVLIGPVAYLAWAYEICVLSLSYQWIVQRQAIEKILNHPGRTSSYKSV